MHACGGVLIRDKWVVTATHCLRSFIENGKEVAFLIDKNGEFKHRIKADRIFEAPARFIGTDLALIRLTSSAIEIGATPINFATANTPGEKVKLVAMGMRDYNGEELKPPLQELDTYIYENYPCESSGEAFNSEHDICVGQREVDAHTMYVDSVSPLVRKNWFTGEYEAIGVVSANPTDNWEHFSIFTYYSPEIISWINKTILENS